MWSHCRNKEEWAAFHWLGLGKRSREWGRMVNKKKRYFQRKRWPWSITMNAVEFATWQEIWTSACAGYASLKPGRHCMDSAGISSQIGRPQSRRGISWPQFRAQISPTAAVKNNGSVGVTFKWLFKDSTSALTHSSGTFGRRLFITARKNTPIVPRDVWRFWSPSRPHFGLAENKGALTHC